VTIKIKKRTNDEVMYAMIGSEKIEFESRAVFYET
jgi:hypothetical protein